jgi:hypothetical protein
VLVLRIWGSEELRVRMKEKGKTGNSWQTLGWLGEMKRGNEDTR